MNEDPGFMVMHTWGYMNYWSSVKDSCCISFAQKYIYNIIYPIQKERGEVTFYFILLSYLNISLLCASKEFT